MICSVLQSTLQYKVDKAKSYQKGVNRKLRLIGGPRAPTGPRKSVRLVVDPGAGSRCHLRMEIAATHHATLVFERRIPAPVEAVFHAFADPTQRAEWGAPSDTAVILYDSADFRPGGVDRFRCGSRSNPNFRGTTWYLQIVENSRIVSTEMIEMEGKPLSAALTTLELWPEGETSLLKSTSQVVSFVGSEMIKNYQTGNDGSLDSLVRHFAGQTQRAR
jgi:uncharacterized protein YndB with AHSA1/START domain